MQIDVLEELRSYDLPYEQKTSGHVVVNCPFHGEKNPSCSINLETQRFKCFGCNEKGNFPTLLARHLGQPIAAVYTELAKKYVTESSEKVVNPHNVETAVKALQDGSDLSQQLLKDLKRRGISKENIRQYRLGRYEDCVTIPITNESGGFVNIRYHRTLNSSNASAPKSAKIFNVKGFGKTLRIFPLEQLEFDTILLTGGELKAIASSRHVNKRLVGCVTATCGEGVWDIALTGAFKDKKVYICYDIDDVGQKANEQIARMLATTASEVYLLRLPLDIKKFPKGDLNNFIEQGGDFDELFKLGVKWEPRFLLENEYDINEPPKKLSFEEALKSEHTTKKVGVKTIVASMDMAPYLIPWKVEVNCSRNEKFCGTCPVFLGCKPDKQEIEIGKENPALLGMVQQKEHAQTDALKKCLSIPKVCRACEFKIHKFYTIEDLRISRQLEITDRSSERPMQAAYCVTSGKVQLEMNESYEMQGRVFPHPQTQQSVFLISSFNTTLDALSSYKPENSALRELQKTFSPETWTIDSLREKLNGIYEDLEANVTRIFQRRNLHLCIDLCYHSSLFFIFDGEVRNGWVESLIVGDSAQGKTETLQGLLRYYGLGELVECKGVTEAGLKGGLQKTGNRWFVTWGVFPMNDRRLIALDELKGASSEVISKLTAMRSSGVAEVTKIEKRRAHARTRCIALSNPRKSKTISSYNFGIDAIVELIGALEDIRRFTMCLIVDRNEVNVTALHDFRPSIANTHTAELCRELILWGWTLEPKDILFEDESVILSTAKRMCSKYTDDIPIVDRGEFRLKLAKLCVALAIRTCSLTEENKLLVRNCHVQFIEQYLTEIYDSPYFGYADVSRQAKSLKKIPNTDSVKERLRKTAFPRDFAEYLLSEEQITLHTIQDFLSVDFHEARESLSFLLRHRALKRNRFGSYDKTEAFTMLLKTMIREDDFPKVPKHLKEDEF